MAISDTAKGYLLGGLIGSDRVTAAPATLYIGLSSTAVTATNGVLSGHTEPTTGSYARASVANTDTEWDIAAGVAENANAILFPEADADYDVDPAYYFVATAATNGTILYSGALGRTITVVSGVRVVLEAGSVTLTAS